MQLLGLGTTRVNPRHDRPARCGALSALFWLLSILAGRAAEAACEGFATDPVTGGRFSQLTAGTESTFEWDQARQSMLFRSDVDASPAWFLSATPFSPLTEATDASFSVRFRVTGFDDQESPKATIGLLTTTHVGAGGAGLSLLLSVVNGNLVANAQTAFTPIGDQTGPGIGLQAMQEYLAVGRYRAATRAFTVEILDGAGFTNLVGFSTALVPSPSRFALDRIGLQNDGFRRNFDSTIGSITMEVDDLCSPAALPHRLAFAQTELRVSEGNADPTHAQLLVTLTPASSEPTLVVCETIPGSAQAGRDFIAFRTNLLFAARQREIAVPITVLGDVVDEWDESFRVALRDPQGANLGPATEATVVILDNDEAPSVCVQDASALEGESGAHPMEFAVLITGASEKQPLEIRYETESGSATAGLDFTSVSDSITLPPEVMSTNTTTRRSFAVPILGDTIFEKEGTNLWERFTVRLSSSPDLQLRCASAIGTILDDEDRVFTITGPIAAREGPAGTTNRMVFILRSSRPAGSTPVQVMVAAANGPRSQPGRGSATVNLDLSPLTRVVRFTNGVTEVEVSAEIWGDALPEPDEDFELKLSDPVGGRIDPILGQATGTILNDDFYPTAQVDDVRVLERDTETTNAVITVTLDAPAIVPVQVIYSTSPGTATSGMDYQSVEQSRATPIDQGQRTTSFSIPVLGDVLDEAEETFSVRIRVVQGESTQDLTARVVIEDNDQPPEATVLDAGVVEGDSGLKDAVFRVSLSSASEQEVPIDYSLVNGTAIIGEDFLLPNSAPPLKIPAGSTSAEIRVRIVGDRVREANEDYFVQLGILDPQKLRLGIPNRARGIITNDDDLPKVTLVSAPTVAEGRAGASTNAMFTLRLDRASTAPISVRYWTENGTAKGGATRATGIDFRAVITPADLTIPPGELSASIPIEVFGDDVDEVDLENYFLLADLVSTNDAVAVGTLRAEGFIRDDDTGLLSVGDATLTEGDSGTRQASFLVSLSTPSDRPVRVRCQTQDETARAGDSDYVPLSQVIEFPPGSTTAYCTVELRGDIECEADETFQVRLSDAEGATITDDTGFGKILDDDTTRVTVDEPQVYEGDEGTTTNLVFTLRLAPPPKSPITIHYRLERRDGGVSDTLIVPSGVASTNLVVHVRGDNRFAEDELVRLVIDATECAILSQSSFTGRILNDDPLLELVQVSFLEEECKPDNSAIDPGESLKVVFPLSNSERFGATNLSVCLLPFPGLVFEGESCSQHPVVAPEGRIFPSFRFHLEGTCGDIVPMVLQISEGGFEAGRITNIVRLGVRPDGKDVCCNPIDLAVTASAAPNPVVVGNVLTYDVVVTNQGSSSVGNVLLTNRLDESLVVTSVTSERGSCDGSGRTWICSLGTLGVGDATRVQVLATSQAPATLVSFFVVGGSGSDQDPTNNLARVVTQVNPADGLSISPVTIVEGTGGNTNASLKIWLWPARNQPVTVDVETLAGTATAGADFIPFLTNLTFNPRETEKTVTVTVIGDAIAEDDETFQVRLVNARGETRVGPAALGTIIDDDCTRLTVADVTVHETFGFAEFEVRLTGAAKEAVSFDYRTVAGTGLPGLDFVAVQGTTNIARGQDHLVIRVPVLNDGEYEDEERFSFLVTNVVGGCPSRIEAIGTLVNDDPPPISVSITNTFVLEGSPGHTNYLLFPVRLSRPQSANVSVRYFTRDETAKAGEDYVAVTNGIVTFNPEGQGFASVAVLGDERRETNETVQVVLTDPIGAVLAPGQGSAQGTILNDEYLPEISPVSARLADEDCPPGNAAIDPLETVQVRFTLKNIGLAATTNLVGTLEIQGSTSVRILAPIPVGRFGSIAPGASVSIPYSFRVLGSCGDEFLPVLRLEDNGNPVGAITFPPFRLGTLINGIPTCCSQADLAVLGGGDSERSVEQPVAYTLSVTNLGPSEATGVKLRTRLGTGVELTSVRSSRGTCSLDEDLLTCEFDTLSSHATAGVNVTVVHHQLGRILTLSSVVAASTEDPVGTNNFATVYTSVRPPPGIRIDHATVTETNGALVAEFHIEVDPAPLRGETIQVHYSTRDGTARAQADYAPTNGTALLTYERPIFTVQAVVYDDTEDEPDEAFFVDLMNPVGRTLSERATGIGTILDNDQPCLFIEDVSVDVGFKGAVVALVPVRLSSPSDRAILFDYTTRVGSAFSGTDFGATNGTILLPPGTTRTNLQVVVSGNTVDEGVEHFFFDLSNATNTRICDETAVVTITDMIPGELIVRDASVVEGDTETNLVFELELIRPTGAPGSPASIKYRTVGVSAQPGEDFMPSTNVVSFPPGVSRTNVLVRVVGDYMWERPETLELRFDSPQNLVLPANFAAAIGTIIDDDPLPRLSLLIDEIPEGNSGQSSASLRAQLSNPSSEAITVRIATIPETANVPGGLADYLALTTNIVFLPKELNRNLPLFIVGDRRDEFDETFLVRATILGTNAAPQVVEARATILDDDDPPTLSILPPQNITEGNSGTHPASFVLTLSAPSGKPLSWTYRTAESLTAEDRAAEDVDFLGTFGDQALAADQSVTRFEIPVSIVGDTLPESNESFRLLITNMVNLSAVRAESRAIILDDDNRPTIQPPTIRWIAPIEGTVFPACQTMDLRVQAQDLDGPLDRVEFFRVGAGAGSVLLGSTRIPAPESLHYSFSFADSCEEGEYTFRARAIDSQGLDSYTADLTVRVIAGDILVIRRPGDCETDTILEHLDSSRGPEEEAFKVLNRKKFAWEPAIVREVGPDQMTADLLAGFRVVIWESPLAPVSTAMKSACDAEVEALWAARNRGVGLYLIGERLTEFEACISPSVQDHWRQIIGRIPGGRSAGPGQFVRQLPEARPYELFDAHWGVVHDFALSSTIRTGEWSGQGEVRARMGSEPVLVRFPAFDEFDDPHLGRRLVQSFRVTDCGKDVREDLDSLENRRILLRNGVLWLMGGACDAFIAELTPTDSIRANQGSRFPVYAKLHNNGECSAGGVIVTQVIPAGLAFAGAKVLNEELQDFPAVVSVHDQTVTFGLGVIPNGTTLFLRTWLDALRSGTFETTYQRQVNFREDVMKSTFIEVVNDCIFPTLEVFDGRLTVRGNCNLWMRLEESVDLTTWTPVMDIPPVDEQLVLPIDIRGLSGIRFYRLVTPEEE